MTRQCVQRSLQFFLDLAALICSWNVSIALQTYVLPAAGLTRWSQAFRHAPPLSDVVIAWAVLALWAGVYRSSDTNDSLSRLRAALHTSIAVAFAIIIASFISAEQMMGRARSLALLVTPISFLLFHLVRGATSGLFTYLSRSRLFRRGVAVLGNNDDAFALLEHLRISEGDCVKGLIIPEGKAPHRVYPGTVILGTTRDIAKTINRERLERIFMLNGALSETELETCSEVAARMGVTVSCAVTIAAPPQSLSYSVYSGIPLVEVQPVSFTATERIVKRFVDILGSSVLLILLGPLFTLIAFLVKASSDGPILFTAPRVGRGGRYFSFLKFRTMYAGSSRMAVVTGNEKDGHLFKIKDDPRITPVGRFLRRYSLDELPQLINVLLGDMSLVGPRPLPIEDMEPDGMSQKFAIWSEQRASVPPGITGLWQIRGRSELPFTDLVKYDLEYVHNWSLGLDLRILFSTPGFVLSGKGAF